MNTFFPEIQKNFGFGCMRFPKIGEEVDIPAVEKMVDAFLAAGFNYFDTARPYHGGMSETVLQKTLTSRYPRERYLLTDKLTPGCFETEEEILPFFQSQLERCGVDYFDFYLFHANSAKRHEFFSSVHAYDIVQELKAQGKIRHVGMSFHDTAEVLDKILTDRPEIEVVQLQFNYADYLDPKVQSKACYDVCVKHGKPVLVMEPVKGGSLANLPSKATELLTASPASYAIRFAASFENIVMVLSGMSNMEQVMDNIGYMKDFQPLTEEEFALIEKLRTIYQAQHRIPCTACRYCTDGCPASIDIPGLFACMNDKREGKEGVEEAYAAQENKADACLECGQCEKECPQHLHIRELLKEVAAAF
ncbi:MAG: aldo/keto reductase [Oscillospiraceae bacterium]|nr:aldo/keto reductase [Oscillospiraceae bacterium]